MLKSMFNPKLSMLELSISGSDIFVGDRWAELGFVKNWAKSSKFWVVGFFE
jgi:hypothetical protein